MYKENDFVLITTIMFNKGQKDESYKTYSGIVAYETEKSLAFHKAVVHHIYTNGKTYINMSTFFSIDKSFILSE